MRVLYEVLAVGSVIGGRRSFSAIADWYGIAAELTCPCFRSRATAIVAAIGNGAAFKKGRGLSAWLGIVPGEYTTGGKQKLLGISKRGNSYLRRLLVQGARAVPQQSAKQSSGLSAWLTQRTTRAYSNVAAIALANKLARMAWAVLAKNETYRPNVGRRSYSMAGLQMTPG